MGMPEDDGAARMPPLTHVLLAEYLGTSRQVICHLMHQFQAQGYLRYSRKDIALYPNAFKEWLRQNTGGTSTTNACVTTAADFLGCCVSATAHTRNCYFGLAASKQALANGCNAVTGAKFCD